MHVEDKKVERRGDNPWRHYLESSLLVTEWDGSKETFAHTEMCPRPLEYHLFPVMPCQVISHRRFHFLLAEVLEERDFFQAKIVAPVKPVLENIIIIPWKKKLVGILSMDFFFHSTQDLYINRLLKVNCTSVLVFPQQQSIFIPSLTRMSGA